MNEPWKPPPLTANPQLPEPEPDFADEVAPKSSEFATEKDAKDITAGEFDLFV